MENVSTWVLSVCSALIVCEIFNLITPDNKYKKTITIVLSVFFLLCFISPFAKGFADFNNIKISAEKELVEKADKTDEIISQIYSKTSEKIQIQMNEILKKNNIEPEKINIVISSNENKSIILDKVQIILKKSNIAKTTQTEKLIFENY
ncbi:MAG: stage III sporulation protein AF, partial [Oscillospiraceae bacterium]